MKRSILFVVSALAAACSSNASPFAGGNGDGGAGQVDASPPGTPDAGISAGTPDAGPPEHCAPKPTRMVVLGDSIAACTVVGGASATTCAYSQFHDYVAKTYATGITYENVAVGGAITEDVPTQQMGIKGGAGHVLVVIQVGGNNLAPYMFQSDAAAQAGYDKQLPTIRAAWDSIFAYFGDTTKFPDGATIFVSNQYNPFDDCTASPYFLSATKIMLLHQYNMEIANIAAAHPSAKYVDQFTSFLGHGHHFDVMTCPHYTAGAEAWMQDLIHANAPGNVHLAKVLGDKADAIYKTCVN